MSQHKFSRLKLLLFSGVTLLFFVIAVEGYSRVRTCWATGNRNYLFWRPKVVLKERQNNVGFRGPDMEWAKPLEVLRVAALGGSTTFGFGNTLDRETYPRQLEGILREKYQPLQIEVINAGLNHGRSHAVLKRAPAAANLGADVIVIYSGYNDYDKGKVPQWGKVSKIVGELGDYEIQPNFFERLVHRLSLESVFFLRLREKIAKYWYGDINAYYRRKQIQKTVTEEVPLTPQIQDAVDQAVQEFVSVYQANLRRVIVFARLHGAEVVLAKIPIYRQHPWAQHMIDSGSLDAINQAVQALAEEYGLPVADVEGAFDAHPRPEDLFNLDWLHLSPEGNGLIAKTVAETIRKAGLIPNDSF